MIIRKVHIGRLTVAILLGWYTLRYVVLRTPYTVIDNANLLFHEAGHVIFGFTGEFIMMFGGTLMQMLVPISIIIYFFRKQDRFASVFGVWWLGQNMINIAYYISDARAQVLPLLGGGRHDWNYLLTRIGLINQDELIGGIVFFTGSILMLVSVVYMLRKSFGDR
jgi:hypothetical protein